MHLNKKYLFPFFILLLHLNQKDIHAQKNFINASYSNQLIEDDIFWVKDNLVNFQLDYTKEIKDFINFGGYAGFGIFDEWHCEILNEGQSYESYDQGYSLHYGLKTNINLLPLFLKKDIPRFSFYISGSTGINSLLSSTSDKNFVPRRGHYLGFSILGGCALYISKKAGIFTELGYLHYRYSKGFNTRYGLTFRF